MLTPGPFATQILADLGATVLKIERPPFGDLERVTMPAYYRAYNRGKHSIALDLKDVEDMQTFRSLVPDAHVVVEGFRPGAVERLGVSFDALTSLQPRLIYMSLSGFGPSGPRVEQRAHDPEFQALAGSLHFNRGHDGKPFYNTAGPTFDYAAGLFAVIGILAVRQNVNHDAVHLNVPCLAAGLSLMFPRLVDALEMDHDIATFDIIMAGSDGKWLTFAAPEDNTWAPLCAAIDRPDLEARSELQSFEGRLSLADEINAALRAAIATRPRDEWAERLAAAGVPSAPILTPLEVLADPQGRHLGIVRTEPSMHSVLPVLGLPNKANIVAPTLDEDGPSIRRDGWAALPGAGI